MMELSFNHEDIVNRIARIAIAQKLIFSANNLMDISINIDPELFKQLALQSVSAFSKDDLVMLEGCVDDDVFVQLYRNKGLKVPDVFLDDVPPYVNPMNQDGYGGKQPSGLFSKLAMAFGIGAGIHQGINDAVGRPDRKFRVGDHVRVRYRGQEGKLGFVSIAYWYYAEKRMISDSPEWFRSVISVELQAIKMRIGAE